MPNLHAGAAVKWKILGCPPTPPNPHPQILIGRKTNDTDTYSNEIVLIANLPKEASFPDENDFGL